MSSGLLVPARLVASRRTGAHVLLLNYQRHQSVMSLGLHLDVPRRVCIPCRLLEMHTPAKATATSQSEYHAARSEGPDVLIVREHLPSAGICSQALDSW